LLVICRCGYRDSHHSERDDNEGCEMHDASMVVRKGGG
jgi:hypothetical protein